MPSGPWRACFRSRDWRAGVDVWLREAVREAEDRDQDPSAAVADSQLVEADTNDAFVGSAGHPSLTQRPGRRLPSGGASMFFVKRVGSFGPGSDLLRGMRLSGRARDDERVGGGLG